MKLAFTELSNWTASGEVVLAVVVQQVGKQTNKRRTLARRKSSLSSSLLFLSNTLALSFWWLWLYSFALQLLCIVHVSLLHSCTFSKEVIEVPVKVLFPPQCCVVHYERAQAEIQSWERERKATVVVAGTLESPFEGLQLRETAVTVTVRAAMAAVFLFGRSRLRDTFLLSFLPSSASVRHTTLRHLQLQLLLSQSVHEASHHVLSR